MTKKEIYASYGIKYENGKIFNPMFGWISPMLVNGNAKLGKGVWTFSTLAGNAIYDIVINNKSYSVKGTCVCNCVGCYAQTGFYKMPSTLKALAIRTLIAQLMPTWLENAIIAQIKAENIQLCRIHASGDFFSAEYVNVWRSIVKACDTCVLVLPSGRSAHTEAGWFSGKGRTTIAYIPERQEPELMYKLFSGVCCSIDELIETLK